MAKAEILLKAEFNPKIKKYLLVFGSLLLCATLVGIVLLPIFLIIAPIFIKKYFNRLSAELTTRALRFEKGLIFHVERTIPLDKIQDLTFKEGPLLKKFDLAILKIETAGNTGAGQSDLTLIGIKGATNFRNRVLDQRDMVTDNKSSSDSESDGITVKLLKEIRDSLKVIEQKVGN